MLLFQLGKGGPQGKGGRRDGQAAADQQPQGEEIPKQVGHGAVQQGQQRHARPQIRAALGRAKLMRRLSLSRSRLRAYTKRPNRAKLPPTAHSHSRAAAAATAISTPPKAPPLARPS